jgi:hypothetical protein
MWSKTESETEITKSKRRIHHTKASVRRRRASTRRKWRNRLLGVAALGTIGALAYKHRFTRSPKKDSVKNPSLIYLEQGLQNDKAFNATPQFAKLSNVPFDTRFNPNKQTIKAHKFIEPPNSQFVRPIEPINKQTPAQLAEHLTIPFDKDKQLIPYKVLPKNEKATYIPLNEVNDNITSYFYNRDLLTHAHSKDLKTYNKSLGLKIVTAISSLLALGAVTMYAWLNIYKPIVNEISRHEEIADHFPAGGVTDIPDPPKPLPRPPLGSPPPIDNTFNYLQTSNNPRPKPGPRPPPGAPPPFLENYRHKYM